MRTRILFVLAVILIAFTTAIVTASVTTYITITLLDARWQEYVNKLEAEHTTELGRAEVHRIEAYWRAYYSVCFFVTNGGRDKCLESARNGYIEGVHDMKPMPGFDWHYIQYGRYLDSG